MQLKERNYWLDTVEKPFIPAERPLPERVDVAVIGAGFTGLSAARSLARHGASVAVMEAQTVGWGASCRNGGMVLTGLKVGAKGLIAKYGRERARRLYTASVDSISCVEQIVREDGIECNFNRSGWLLAAYKPAHFDKYRRAAEIIEREFGHSMRPVTADQLRSEIGSDLYHGGLVDETSAGVNPARYVIGLAQGAERAGAVLHEKTPVQAVKRVDGGFQVSTPRGRVHARDVVVATSGYTTRVTPAIQRRIVPIGSYIIATEVLPESLAADVSPRNRMISDSKNFLYYFRLTPDRRMLFGGRAGFFPESPNTVRESADILRQAMLNVYPQLRDVKVEYAWGGTLDFAFDLMPHAGQVGGLWCSVGYAGHGVALATYMGTTLGDMIAGKPVSNPFTEIPFPLAPLGLYDGRPWFLPFAEIWYKFLDKVR